MLVLAEVLTEACPCPCPAWPQSHQRKLRRLQRRLASLEKRWREHPVHARLSKGALQVRGGVPGNGVGCCGALGFKTRAAC